MASDWPAERNAPPDRVIKHAPGLAQGALHEVILHVPACHGIEIAPTDIGAELGYLDARPRRGVTVELADAVVRAPDAELVWQLDEPAEFGLPPITSQTWRESSTSTWFGNTLNLAMRIDVGGGVITVAAKSSNRQVLLEALASVALPMVAQERGSLVLHASAACSAGGAVMLCAAGGSGKSSLMVGLLARGWKAISEDQCVIDLDGEGRHRVWPGPNWVRFKQGVQPVWPVSERRFEALDKVAWTINSWMAYSPARLDRIVFLDPPGGEEALWESVPPHAAISRLIPQATWLRGQDSFARSVLPQLVNLVQRVPAFRMRLPRRDDWLSHGIALLTREERDARNCDLNPALTTLEAL